MMKSLTDGAGPIKDESLGVADSRIGKSPYFRHVRTCKRLCASPPRRADGAGRSNEQLRSALSEALGMPWASVLIAWRERALGNGP